MSSCCDKYGDCSQSDTCPLRTGVVLPHQAAHAQRVARIKSTRPVWMDGKASTVPSEAGNFKIEYLGPDEGMEFWRTLLLWLFGTVVAVAVVSVAASYGTERFADALWALVQGVS